MEFSKEFRYKFIDVDVFHLQITFHDIQNLSHHIFIVQKYDGGTKTV